MAGSEDDGHLDSASPLCELAEADRFPMVFAHSSQQLETMSMGKDLIYYPQSMQG